MDPGLYTQDRTCSLCSHRFLLPKVRPSALRVESRDSDFCVHYSGLNPNFYAIWACPHCGYAATETTFDDIQPYQRQPVKEALASRPLPPGASEERTPEMAIALYEQAIYLAGVRKLSPSNVAGLHLKLSWIYRDLGDQAKEFEQLVMARDKYLQAFNSERLGGEGKMSESSVAYLIGELHRRTGDYTEAINWLSRLAQDPRTQKEPNVLNLARDGWQLARTQLKDEPESPAPGAAPAPSAAAPATPAVAAPPAPPVQPATAPPPASPGPAGAGSSSLASRLAAAKVPSPESAGAEPTSAASVPPKGRLSLPERDRGRTGRVGTNVSIYTDQVEWLRRAMISSKEQGGNLGIPEFVRAVLDVAVGNVPPEELGVRDEEELRRRLIERLEARG